MQTDDRFSFENSLIISYAHFNSFKLDASLKAIVDLVFDGLPVNYFNLSMTRMQGSRYLMHAYNHGTCNYESYCVDIRTLKAKKLDLAKSNFIRCFVEGEYMLVIRWDDNIAILKDLHEIGQIHFRGMYEYCKNNEIISGRYEQQVDQTIYAMGSDRCLYRIQWQDIKDGKYSKTRVKSGVNHFYADRRLGLATVNMNGTLSLPAGAEVDLRKKVDSKAEWTIVTCIAKSWVVSGHLDLDGHAIMARISKQGNVRSTLKLKLTSNGYMDYDSMEYGGIFTLHQAYVRGRRGIMLAIERDGCCHIISVAHGRLSKLQSTDSLVNVDVNEDEKQRIVTSVTATDIEGEFIAGGIRWTKRITLKL